MPPLGVKAWSVFGTIGLDGLSRSVAQLRAFDAAGKQTAATATGLSAGATALAGGLAAAGVAALALGAKGAQAFAEFDAAMTQSLAIMGDVDEALEQQLADRARDAARDFNVAASDVAQGFFFLASAGLSARESLQAIGPVTAFAKAGMFDLATATDLLTDAQSALGLTIRDDAVANMINLTRVSDALVKANTLANATVQQFSESLTNRAAAGLRLVNKEIEEGLAVLAVFADQGIKGAEAGTRLDIVLRDLQRSAITNADAFRTHEIAVFDANDNMRSMADIVEDLESRFEGLSDKQRIATLQTLGFNFRSVQALLTLIGFSDQLRKYESELGKAGDTTQEVAEKQLGTLREELGLLGKEIEDVLLDVGEAEEGGLRALVRGVTDTVRELREEITGVGLVLRGDIRLGSIAFADAVVRAREEIEDIDVLTKSAEKNLDKSVARVRELRDAGAPEEVVQQAEAINRQVLRLVQRVFVETERAQEAAERGLEEEARQRQRIAQNTLETAIRLNRDLAALEGDRVEALTRVSLDMLRLQAEIGEASKQQLLERLREELGIEEEGTERAIELRREIFQVEQQIERERLATTRRRERMREAEMQKQREAARERIELAEREMQHAIRTGELTLQERLRQVQVALALAELTTGQRIELEEEQFEIAKRLTDEQIQKARQLATTNTVAAQQVLRSWKQTLDGLGLAFPALLDEIDEGMEDVGQRAKESFDKVAKEIEDEAESVGRSIISGIIRGGQSVSGILERAFEQILTTAIIQVGTKLLGIGSPSRVTFAWGEDVVDGMVRGMEGRVGDVQRAARKLAAAAVPDRAAFEQRLAPIATPSPVQEGFGGAGIQPQREEPQRPMEITLNVQAPPQRRPTDFIRDAEWQEALRNSLLVAEDQGFRFRGN